MSLQDIFIYTKVYNISNYFVIKLQLKKEIYLCIIVILRYLNSIRLTVDVINFINS